MTTAQSPIATAVTAAAQPADKHPAPPPGPDVPHAVFTYDVDEVTYEYDHPTITGAEIMAAASIPVSEGIIQILPDGTRESVAPDAVIHLASGAQFKRRPRFKRG
jgi:hypothetical protein